MLSQRFGCPLWCSKNECLKCNLSQLPHCQNSPALPYSQLCILTSMPTFKYTNSQARPVFSYTTTCTRRWHSATVYYVFLEGECSRFIVWYCMTFTELTEADCSVSGVFNVTDSGTTVTEELGRMSLFWFTLSTARLTAALARRSQSSSLSDVGRVTPLSSRHGIKTRKGMLGTFWWHDAGATPSIWALVPLRISRQ